MTYKYDIYRIESLDYLTGHKDFVLPGMFFYIPHGTKLPTASADILRAVIPASYGGLCGTSKTIMLASPDRGFKAKFLRSV